MRAVPTASPRGTTPLPASIRERHHTYNNISFSAEDNTEVLTEANAENGSYYLYNAW